MSNIFFTSDTHWGHAKILSLGEGRPFASIEAHDEALIENWNSVVAKGDTVYHLGDLSFAKLDKTVEIITRLNGQIHLFNGNHDRFNRKLFMLLPRKIQWVGDYKELRIEDQKIVLMHYPLGSWNGAFEGAWMLHGHSHGMYKFDGRGPILDVGVDSYGFTPASFEVVRADMVCTQPWEDRPNDGHTRAKITPVVPHEEAIAEQRAVWAGTPNPLDVP